MKAARIKREVGGRPAGTAASAASGLWLALAGTGSARIESSALNPAGQQAPAPASPGAPASARPAARAGPAPPTPAAPPAADDQTPWISQLHKLAQLHDQGVLSDAEYAAVKQRILRPDKQPQPPGTESPAS